MIARRRVQYLRRLTRTQVLSRLAQTQVLSRLAAFRIVEWALAYRAGIARFLRYLSLTAVNPALIALGGVPYRWVDFSPPGRHHLLLALSLTHRRKPSIYPAWRCSASLGGL